MTVRLGRIGPGRYEAVVRAIDSGCEPFTLIVYGQFRNHPAHRQWVVVSDDERFFLSLKEARAYIDRFFEEAR